MIQTIIAFVLLVVVNLVGAFLFRNDEHAPEEVKP